MLDDYHLPRDCLNILQTPGDYVDNEILYAAFLQLHLQFPDRWGKPAKGMGVSRCGCSLESGRCDACKLSYMQYHHNGKNHWVLIYVKVIERELLVLNSLPSHHHGIEENMVKEEIGHDHPFDIILVPSPQQPDGHSCGYFVIANAVEIVFGADVYTMGGVSYDVGRMRDHLLQCLVNRRMEPFPKM